VRKNRTDVASFVRGLSARCVTDHVALVSPRGREGSGRLTDHFREPVPKSGNWSSAEPSEEEEEEEEEDEGLSGGMAGVGVATSR
jgi:hypothetical protein